MTPSLKLKKKELQSYVDLIQSRNEWRGEHGQSKDLIWTIPPDWMDWVVALLTKIHVRQNHSAYWVALDEMVTLFLQADKTQFNSLRSCPVLIIRFGQEYTQQIHHYVFKHLLEMRSNLKLYHTIWLTTLSKGEVQEKYGRDNWALLEMRGSWV